MALNVTSKVDTLSHPIFLKILEDIPGGIILLTDRIPLATKMIKKGSLLSSIITTLGSTLASTGMYRLVKTAKVAVGSDTSAVVTIGVYTNHEFKVGEFIGKEGEFTGVTIAAISKGVITDQMVFTAGLGIGSTGVASGIILEEKTSATVKTELYAADVILRTDCEVRSSDLTTLRNIAAGAVVRGTVNESLLPYFVTATDKTALTSRIRWA